MTIPNKCTSKISQSNYEKVESHFGKIGKHVLYRRISTEIVHNTKKKLDLLLSSTIVIAQFRPLTFRWLKWLGTLPWKTDHFRWGSNIYDSRIRNYCPFPIDRSPHSIFLKVLKVEISLKTDLILDNISNFIQFSSSF